MNNHAFYPELQVPQILQLHDTIVECSKPTERQDCCYWDMRLSCDWYKINMLYRIGQSAVKSTVGTPKYSQLWCQLGDTLEQLQKNQTPKHTVCLKARVHQKIMIKEEDFRMSLLKPNSILLCNLGQKYDPYTYTNSTCTWTCARIHKLLSCNLLHII